MDRAERDAGLDAVLVMEPLAQPDRQGQRHPRCQHILLPTDRKSRAVTAPRQCRRAALRGHSRCDQHLKDGEAA